MAERYITIAANATAIMPQNGTVTNVVALLVAGGAFGIGYSVSATALLFNLTGAFATDVFFTMPLKIPVKEGQQLAAVGSGCVLTLTV